MSHHGHQHHAQSFAPAYGQTAYPPIAPYGVAAPVGFGSPTPYGYGYQPVPNEARYAADHYRQGQRLELLDHARRKEQHHRRNKQRAEMGAAAAGAFALYEAHEAKVDPAHARRHRLEAEIAGAAAVGAAGYAMHEHMERKSSEHLVEHLGGGSGHQDHHNHHHGHEKKHHHHLWK